MKNRVSINGTVNIPHQALQCTSTLIAWQLLGPDRDENQNSEKGVKTPELSACCYRCCSIATAALFDFLFVNHGAI